MVKTFWCVHQIYDKIVAPWFDSVVIRHSSQHPTPASTKIKRLAYNYDNLAGIQIEY